MLKIYEGRFSNKIKVQYTINKVSKNYTFSLF